MSPIPRSTPEDEIKFMFVFEIELMFKLMFESRPVEKVGRKVESDIGLKTVEEVWRSWY